LSGNFKQSAKLYLGIFNKLHPEEFNVLLARASISKSEVVKMAAARLDLGGLNVQDVSTCGPAAQPERIGNVNHPPRASSRISFRGPSLRARRMHRLPLIGIAIGLGLAYLVVSGDNYGFVVPCLAAIQDWHSQDSEKREIPWNLLATGLDEDQCRLLREAVLLIEAYFETSDAQIRKKILAELERLLPTKPPVPPALTKSGILSPYAVGISLGGTKIGAGLVDHRGRVAKRIPELVWKNLYGPNARAEQILEGIITMIKAALEGEDLARVKKVGVAVCGPVDREGGIAGIPFALPNIPSIDHYPLVQRLKEKLPSVFGAGRMPEITIYDIYNDCFACVLGELSPRGLLHRHKSGMAFILGTGNNGAAVEDGKLFDDNGAFMELGHFLMRDANRRWILLSAKTGARPQLKPGEYEFEDLFKGPNIALEFAKLPEAAKVICNYVEYDSEIPDIFRLLELVGKKELSEAEQKLQEKVRNALLKGITKAVNKGDPVAINFVRQTFTDMGRAFATMVLPYQNMKWVEHIILVSGIGENLALPRHWWQKDILLASVRDGLRESLQSQGVHPQKIAKIAKGIVRSKMSWERELLAAAFTEAEMKQMQCKGIVLVTGAAGYIGSHTVREALRQGYDVVALDSLVKGRKFAINRNAEFAKKVGRRFVFEKVDLGDTQG